MDKSAFSFLSVRVLSQLPLSLQRKSSLKNPFEIAAPRLFDYVVLRVGEIAAAVVFRFVLNFVLPCSRCTFPVR